MKITDDMLKRALTQMAEQEYAQQVCERKEHRFSLRFYWKMHRLFRSVQTSSSREKGKLLELYRPIRLKRRTAMAVLLTAVLGAGTVLAADPVIHWLYDQYIQQGTDHVAVIDDSSGEEQDGVFQVYRPDYVPNGYRLVSEEFDESFKKNRIIYQNQEERVLSIEQSQKEEFNAKLSSDGDKMEEVQVEGWKGYYIPDEKLSALLLSNEMYSIAINSWEPKEELIKIAESLKKQK